MGSEWGYVGDVSGQVGSEVRVLGADFAEFASPQPTLPGTA